MPKQYGTTAGQDPGLAAIPFRPKTRPTGVWRTPAGRVSGPTILVIGSTPLTDAASPGKGTRPRPYLHNRGILPMIRVDPSDTNVSAGSVSHFFGMLRGAQKIGFPRGAWEPGKNISFCDLSVCLAIHDYQRIVRFLKKSSSLRSSFTSFATLRLLFSCSSSRPSRLRGYFSFIRKPSAALPGTSE